MQRVIRFGISDGKLRAATWKLWTPSKKSDVYLACRALGGELKSSLHESGKWHVSYTQKFFENKLAGRKQNRFVQTWPRPTPITAHVTLAYRIVTPHSAVTSPINATENAVCWIPNCPAQNATEIDVFIISFKTAAVVGWPGKGKMGTKCLGCYDLPNGESVWVVHWVIDMPDLSNAFGTKRPRFQYYKGKTKEDLKSGNFRAITFADHSDGSRVIYDFAVKGHKGSAQ